MPNIVILDGHTLNPGDLSWEPLEALGRVIEYERTSPERVVARAEEADILLVNKVLLSREVLQQLPRLRYIAVTATGVNNVDLTAAAERNIPVSNGSGYGAESVAQHVFALLLELTNRTAQHAASVRNKMWSRQPDFSYTLAPVQELAGKTLGIYGFGAIGRQVARLALAFGMKVLVHTRHPQPDKFPEIDFVELGSLFRHSRVLSLHAAMNDANAGIVNRQRLKLMPAGSLLINTARGGLINEPDLLEALQGGPLAGAGLDVLSAEPPPEDHPLLRAPNCLITPHMAWASRESRQRLLDIVVENVASFLQGRPINVVNP